MNFFSQGEVVKEMQNLNLNVAVRYFPYIYIRKLVAWLSEQVI